MIIGTKVYSCRKCQSEDLVKKAQMRPVARNITVKPVVPMACLSAKNALTGDKERTHYKRLSRKIQYAWD